VILHDARSVDSIAWPETDEGRHGRGYLVPLVREGTARFFSDATTMRILELDGLQIPIAVNEAEYRNSPNLSTYGRYVGSPRAGIPYLGWNPIVAAVMSGALGALGAVLKATRIDRCVYVGSGAILRRLEPHLSAAQTRRLTDFLVDEFPRHAIVYGALNSLTHHELLENLRGSGYEILFAGQTRMLLPYGAPASRQQRENRRRDARALAESGYEVGVAEDAPGVAERLAALYWTLNCEKYSTNPIITAAFFERALRDRTLSVRVARKEGRIDGFYAYHVHEDVLFAPVFGYDTSLPQKLGLYRMLVYRLVQDALDQGLTVETGGGADKFKSLRGDQPVPRYGAAYTRHLPPLRRAGWRLLRFYANGPYLSSTRGYLRGCDGAAVTGFDEVPATFAPPPLSPRQAAAELRAALAALARDLDHAAALSGAALALRVAALSATLHNWPEPTPRVEELQTQLGALERRVRKQERAAGKNGSLAEAEALADRAERRGDVAVVAGSIHAESALDLRAAAETVLARARPAGVFLASTNGGKVLLVAALTPDLCARGLSAEALMAAAAPAVGGKGGGRPELAFGGGPRVDAVPEAIEAARRFLAERLDAG
jgi:hypothetical protein